MTYSIRPDGTATLAGDADDMLHPVPADTFRRALRMARAESSKIMDATSDPDDFEQDARYYLTTDGGSGYGVTDDGELIGVHSLVKGRGDALVSHAIAHGATRLDCFDGYLVTLYRRHGFGVTRREANWTPGGPDVVYMSNVWH